VSEGQRLDVEGLASTDEKVELAPILVVDGDPGARQRRRRLSRR